MAERQPVSRAGLLVEHGERVKSLPPTVRRYLRLTGLIQRPSIPNETKKRLRHHAYEIFTMFEDEDMERLTDYISWRDTNLIPKDEKRPLTNADKLRTIFDTSALSGGPTGKEDHK